MLAAAACRRLTATAHDVPRARGALTVCRFVLSVTALLVLLGAFWASPSPALPSDVQLPTMVTAASSPVTVGAAIRDTATLSGGNGPTGSITFQLFGPADASCTGSALTTSTVSVNGDGTYQSAAFTPSRPGLYEWLSSYGGDAANAPVPGVCPATGESSVVLIAVPQLTTIAPPAAAIGVPLTDMVVVSGGSSPTGDLMFSLFGAQASSCSGPPLHTFAAVAVAGNGTYSSGPFIPTAPGSYAFEVAYSGDATNLATTVPCGITSQSTSVTLASPTITGQAPVPESVGGAITGREGFSGGIHPTGTVIFDIYGPNDPTCSGAPAFISPPVVVMGDGTYTSPPFVPTKPGSYNIVARYSGDASNAPQATTCGAAGASPCR